MLITVERAVPVILSCLHNQNIELKAYASSALWVLLYNDQRVQGMLLHIILLD